MSRIKKKTHMKKLFLSAVIAASSVVFADISMGNGAPVVPATPEKQSAVSAEEYTALAKEIFGVMKEMTLIMESVKDQASADAAAAKLGGMTVRMQELQKKAEPLPRPSAEIELQVKSSFDMQEVQQTISRFIGAFIRIGMNNGYGSQALMNAIAPAMNYLPGQQE